MTFPALISLPNADKGEGVKKFNFCRCHTWKFLNKKRRHGRAEQRVRGQEQ